MAIVEQEFIDMTQRLDVEAFWEENALCQTFTTDKPCWSLSFSPDGHWIFGFMDVPSTLRYYRDKAYRGKLHRQVNEITSRATGGLNVTTAGSLAAGTGVGRMHWLM